MVATIKIIPFAVPGALLEQIEAVVAKEAVLQEYIRLADHGGRYLGKLVCFQWSA